MTKKAKKCPAYIAGFKVEDNQQKRDRLLAFILAMLGVAICVIAVFAFAGSQAMTASYDYTVVIDPGHGGVDNGVTGPLTGVKESDLNLAISFVLKEEFEKHGFRAVLTRTDKNGLYGMATDGFKRRDMEKRRDIILDNKANMVISVHMNKFAMSSRKGPQAFFEPESEASRLLAERIQTVLNSFTGNSHAALKGDYYILKCTESPSVIVECGFLSNEEDERNLIKESYQKQIAQKIFEGVLLYLSNSDEKIIQVQ